jgi:hypothetical protein
MIDGRDNDGLVCDVGGACQGSPLYTQWVSYGYPAGANFAPLNGVVVPAQ